MMDLSALVPFRAAEKCRETSDLLRYISTRLMTRIPENLLQMKLKVKTLGTVKDAFFVCPVCHHEITAQPYSIKDHCEKHRFDQFFKVSEALLTAWKFAFGSTYRILVRGSEWFRPNMDGLLLYITLSLKDLKKFTNQAHLEEAGERLRASLEVPNINRGLMDASMEPALSGNDQAGQNFDNFTDFVNESGILPDPGFLAPAEVESSNF
jgi:hypothetical protein